MKFFNECVAYQVKSIQMFLAVSVNPKGDWLFCVDIDVRIQVVTQNVT